MNFSTKIKWLFLLTTTAILFISPDFGIWVLHVLFEFVEGTLDEIIEHLFLTDRRTTQIIVFYLMWAMILYPAYLTFRYAQKRMIEFKETLPCWCIDKKEQAKSNWQEQPFNKKCKVISGCCLGAIGLGYLVFL